MPRVWTALRLVMLAVTLLHALMARAAAPTQLNNWSGEYFDKKQGALYFKYQLKGFKAGKQQSVITGSLTVTIRNILKDKLYFLGQAQSAAEEAPRDLWKLPAGKYLIESVTMVDAAGTKRSWEPEKEGKKFIVKRQTISNLGIWTLSPKGEGGLGVSFKMADNSYSEDGKRKQSSVAAVVDGFTGLVQEKFAGKAAKKGAADDYSSKTEARASYTFTREIAMFYSLNLFRYNYHAKQIAGVLSASDAQIRRCYTDRLDENEKLKGEAKFSFLLSKQTGTMSKLKHSGGGANDAKLIECMYLELGQIQFPVPENMIGELVYTFDVR